MIKISKKVTPEELEEMKRSISEKIEIIRQNAEDEHTLMKMEEFSASLNEADSKFKVMIKKRNIIKNLISV